MTYEALQLNGNLSELPSLRSSVEVQNAPLQKMSDRLQLQRCWPCTHRVGRDRIVIRRKKRENEQIGIALSQVHKGYETWFSPPDGLDFSGKRQNGVVRDDGCSEQSGVLHWYMRSVNSPAEEYTRHEVIQALDLTTTSQGRGQGVEVYKTHNSAAYTTLIVDMSFTKRHHSAESRSRTEEWRKLLRTA